MSICLYVSFPKEYEIIELDLEKVNLEKVSIIKSPKADVLTKGWQEMLDAQLVLITLFFIRDSVLSSFSLTPLSFLSLLWCENSH